MKRPQLRLLCVLSVTCVALLSGCATSASHTSQPISPDSSVVSILSLEKSATPIPNVLSAVDATTGKLLWRFHPANLSLTSAVPGRDVIYVGATDQRVYALAKGSGQARWQAQIGGFPNVEAVAGNIVIAMATSYANSVEYNVVYALNAGDGKAIWHTDLQRGVVRAIAADQVYVESGGQDEPAIIALDIGTGAQLWQYRLGHNTAQWQLLDGQIYIQTSPSRNPLTSVRLVVSGSTGRLLWRFPSTGEAVIWWLRVADGHVYVEHGDSGGQSTAAVISAFDAASGALKWQQQAPANGSALVGAGNGSLYATTRTELVALRSEDGKEQWRSTVGGGVAGMMATEPMVVSGAVYAAITGVGLVKFNASDGSQAWHVSLDDLSGFAIATVKQGMFYMAQLLRNQILALDTATGKLLWRYDVAASIADVTAG